MRDYLKFYINGEWVDPVTPRALDVDQPGQRRGLLPGFPSAPRPMSTRPSPPPRPRSRPSPQPRTSTAPTCSTRSSAVYQKRLGDMAGAISEEMGAPGWLAARRPGARRAWATSCRPPATSARSSSRSAAAST